MKTILLLLFLFQKGVPHVGPPSISDIRTLYRQAAYKEIYCKELLRLLAPVEHDGHPLCLGYRGVANMMMAQYAGNPFTKLAYFKQGRRSLESAIVADSDNAELRFLRLAVQEKAPAFLGYKSDIRYDRMFLSGAVHKMADTMLKNDINAYMHKLE